MDNQNILAVVAGEEITQKDLDALIAALPKEQQKDTIAYFAIKKA